MRARSESVCGIGMMGRSQGVDDVEVTKRRRQVCLCWKGPRVFVCLCVYRWRQCMCLCVAVKLVCVCVCVPVKPPHVCVPVKPLHVCVCVCGFVYSAHVVVCA